MSTVAKPERARRISSAVLIAANLVPLVGVLAFGWDIALLMVLFWFDNVAVGVWNIAKLLSLKQWVMAPFFALHYGMFMLVHGVFVVVLFVAGPFGAGASGDGDVGVLLATAMVPAAAAFVSHGASFFLHFLPTERHILDASKVMARPYARMAVLHVTIIATGFLVATTGAPIVALVLLVVLKTVIDTVSHLREHRQPGAPKGTAS